MAKGTSARDRIVVAYFRLLLERGRDGVVLKQVCHLADINRTTFYYHFKGIGDLERQVVGEFMDGVFRAGLVSLERTRLQSDAPASKDELSRAGWLAITTFVYGHREQATAFIENGFQNMMLKAYTDAFRSSGMVPPVVADASLREGPDTQYLHTLLNAFVVTHSSYSALSAIDFIVHRGFRDSAEQIADVLHLSFSSQYRTA